MRGLPVNGDTPYMARSARHAQALAHEPAAEEVIHEDVRSGEAVDAPREFASVTITVDHLSEVAPHTVVKTIWSTECAQESLLSQIRYFNQAPMLTDPGLLALANEGLRNDVIYVYNPSDAQSNIIVDGPVWTRILKEAGTMLEAVEQVIAVATDLQRHARQAGSDPRLVCYVAPPID